MPELQEVFRMVTQKVDQDDGALERQVAKQRRAARNRRVGAFTVVALLIAATVAVFVSTGLGTDGTPAGSVSPTAAPAFGALATGSMLNLDTGAVTPLPASIGAEGTYYAVSPDHSTLAFNACCVAPGPIQVSDIDGTNVRAVTPAAYDAYGAQWSPDGATLVYQQRDASTEKLGDLYLVDPSNGERTRLTHLDQSRSWGVWFMFPSFSADGRSVLYHLPRQGARGTTWDLWSVPVEGGTPTLVRRDAGWGGYAPGGNLIEYLSPIDPQSLEGQTLWIAGVDGGAPRALVRSGQIGWPRWSPDGLRIAYVAAGSVYVVNAATGEITEVARGGNPEWVDDHTLIVGNDLIR